MPLAACANANAMFGGSCSPMLYDQHFSAIACALLREKRFDEMDAERKTH